MQLNDGRIVYYGRTCAARNSGKTKQQIKQEIFNEKARQERQLAKMAANAKALAAWQADDFGCPALQAQLCNYHQTGGVSVHGSFSQWLHNRATGVAA
jgi:hypothetical protein